ncbi:MAG: TPR domain protein [Gammaproteobacteria bacterium]|nr:TPR domain protein [Gammaproteobacteria bacterium]
MTIRTYIKSFTLLFSLIAANSVYAQSMTVIGGEQSAKNCFMAATIAAQIHYASTQDIKECTFALENTSLLSKDKAATLINRGIIYVALEEYDLAIKDYDKAYRINPNIAEIHVNRGNMLFMSRIFDQAVTEYTRAIDLDFSKQYIAHYNRGLAYEKMGQLDKAEADYRRALELMPKWNRAQSKLNRILNQTQKG